MSYSENVTTQVAVPMDYSRKRWFAQALRFAKYAIECFPLKTRYGRRDFWQFREFATDARQCFWYGVIGKNGGTK